jgi:hypothetical protein
MASYLDELERLLSEATAGPWFFNGYSAVYSEPVLRDHDEKEDALPMNPTAEQWASLPEPRVCDVQIAAGDTATAQGRANAAAIVALRNAAPALLARLRAAEAVCEATTDTGIAREEIAAWQAVRQ